MKNSKFDWYDVFETAMMVVAVAIFIALLFCGLEFGIHNLILMTTATGFTAVIFFFIGVFSILIFIMFVCTIVGGIRQSIKEHKAKKKAKKNNSVVNETKYDKYTEYENFLVENGYKQ